MKNLIFNPEGNDSYHARQIWHGNTTNLCNLNNVKYNWATHLYKQMRQNFWIPQKINLTEDVVDYRKLTVQERRVFKGIIGYLTFLDSIQTVNLPHLKSPITAPEIGICFAEQISQEAMHNESYQYVIETIIPEPERNEVYEYWRNNKFLYNRCKGIANLYQQYIDNPTDENYLVALFADYLLEGIYFYNGFNVFYAFAYRGLLGSTSDLFKMINRDELSHVRLMQNLLVEAMKIMPYSVEQLLSIASDAVEREIEWTNHITNEEILGISCSSTNEYTKYLANLRLKAIGLPKLYEEKLTNPYKHLEKFADKEAEANSKGNFFEAAVTSYQMSSSIDNWDF